MTPRARRIIVPAVIIAVALSVVAVMFFASPPRPKPLAEQETVAAEDGEEAVPAGGAEETRAEGADAPAPPDDPGTADTTPQDPVSEAAAGQPTVSLDGLRARAPEEGVSGHDTTPESLGSLDPREAIMLVQFSRAGGGVARITFSDIWETAEAKVRADAYYSALARGDPPNVTLPPEELRYVLQGAQPLVNRFHDLPAVPSLAANAIEINGARVNVFDYNRIGEQKDYIWAETAPGRFITDIANSEDEPVLRITRQYRLGATYDIVLEQTVENLTAQPLDVRWYQYGPSSLRPDRARYMDRRRYRFGYLMPQQTADHVWSDDSDLLLDRGDVLKRWEKALEAERVDSVLQRLLLWPNEASREQGYVLSWFGTTNRYFSLTVHPLPDVTGLSLAPNVEEIIFEVSEPGGGASDSRIIFTILASPLRTVPPASAERFDFGVFAGPLDRHILGEQQPYVALSMDALILYQMSSCCAACTFQWLAHVLLAFLSLVHDLLNDWGIAIILLVLVVRVLLHPITKKSQISMQRFGRAMSAMKPEMDKLQKKFPNDPKRLQQEQIRMMREQGVNPMHAVGCLPMFLQTPIWIALYAMLYFAFDLRHEPAFWGVFQEVTGGRWSFLADLSAGDHFFWEFAQPKELIGFLPPLTGINALPILMGFIFFVQQKYMSPPPSPSMTKEQIQQQKIMKVMMIVLFPVMLYSAPSGLTLYILTSSCIGILESRYIRRHINELDLEKPKKKVREKKRKKPKDAQARAYTAAMDRAQEQRRRRERGPEKRFKKRK